ncbi:hypothetical protein Bbelb_416150 [Branchiostoma belcheri]|nr:hypothetical protein Bbelb_416150 [Branchiostoma belcheri]
MTPVKLAVGVAVLVVVVSVILQPSDARSDAEDEKSLLDLMEGNKEGAVSTGENHGDHDFDGPRVDHEEPERVLKRVKRCGGWGTVVGGCVSVTVAATVVNGASGVVFSRVYHYPSRNPQASRVM